MAVAPNNTSKVLETIQDKIEPLCKQLEDANAKAQGQIEAFRKTETICRQLIDDMGNNPHATDKEKKSQAKKIKAANKAMEDAEKQLAAAERLFEQSSENIQRIRSADTTQFKLEQMKAAVSQVSGEQKLLSELLAAIDAKQKSISDILTDTGGIKNAFRKYASRLLGKGMPESGSLRADMVAFATGAVVTGGASLVHLINFMPGKIGWGELIVASGLFMLPANKALGIHENTDPKVSKHREYFKLAAKSGFAAAVVLIGVNVTTHLMGADSDASTGKQSNGSLVGSANGNASSATAPDPNAATVGTDYADMNIGTYDQNLYQPLNGPTLKMGQRVNVLSIDTKKVKTDFLVRNGDAVTTMPITSTMVVAKITIDGHVAYVPASALSPQLPANFGVKQAAVLSK